MERISFPDHKDRCPHIQTGGPVVFCFFFFKVCTFFRGSLGVYASAF